MNQVQRDQDDDVIILLRDVRKLAWAEGYLAALNDTDAGFPRIVGTTANPYILGVH